MTWIVVTGFVVMALARIVPLGVAQIVLALPLCVALWPLLPNLSMQRPLATSPRTCAVGKRRRRGLRVRGGLGRATRTRCLATASRGVVAVSRAWP